MKRAVVWFHRSRALGWVIVGALSFPLGWANSVVLVWIASVYANVFTDWGAAEAADDRRVLDGLTAIRAENQQLREQLDELTDLIRSRR